MRTYYVCVLRPSDKYTVGGAICRLTFQSLWVFCTTLLIPNLNIRPLTDYSPSFFPKAGKENKCSASTTVMVTSRKRREKHILLKNVVEKRKKEIKEKVSLLLMCIKYPFYLRLFLALFPALLTDQCTTSHLSDHTLVLIYFNQKNLL